MDDHAGQSRTAFNGAGGPVSGYAPGPLVDSMVAAVRKAKPELFDGAGVERTPFSVAQAAGPRFTLEESKAFIASALAGFDKNLGMAARAILASANYNGGQADKQAEAAFSGQAYAPASRTTNPFLDKDYQPPIAENSRWNLTPVAPGQARLMRCIPAGAEQKKWSETQYDPANPRPHAVVEYQFDGTVDGVIYMAHELGHAIADDYQREAGMTYRENPDHIPEMQAYLSQHIVYDALKNHPDPAIAAAARQHFDATILDNLQNLPAHRAMDERPMSILSALGLYNHLKDQGPDARRDATEALLGRKGPKNINEVIAGAGLDERALARSAIGAVGAAAQNAAKMDVNFTKSF